MSTCFASKARRCFIKLVSFSVVSLFVSGCASYGVIDNTPQAEATASGSYSLENQSDRGGSGDIGLILAFSGGGTRAAALAYGVLQELRDTKVTVDGRTRRLLDEVDTISSVSGGSFTSAYYGLYGERIFEDYEDRFLKRNVQVQLIRGLLNPLEWFRSSGRTEMAVKLYEKEIFDQATFADLQRKDAPLILINTSDLGYGVRFSFIQEYFNLLCSDISTFPVARAVAASSAVPVLFNPVVVENYQECKTTKPSWLAAAEQRSRGNPELTEVVDGLQTYYKKDKRQYAHFVDGGITDNLGLRAIYEVIEVAGGARVFLKKFDREPPRHAVIISVNASTDPEPQMDVSTKQPGLKETMDSVTDVQLHRYNAATLELLNESLTRWANELSTPSRPVTPHFIQVSFRAIEQPETRAFFNRIPTSFSLTEEQIDKLILAGRELLRDNPDYQRFVAGLNGGQTARPRQR